MKHSLLKIAFTAMLICMFMHVNAQYETNADRVKFYLDISKLYSPDSYEILQGYDTSFVRYADWQEDWKGLMLNFNTVVHESCHGYNFKIGLKSGWGNEGYFITKGITIAAKKKSFFPSARLNTMVPAEQQEKIFRYNTYVGGEPGISSTLEGIYGFIDEFSAYYHGTKANLDTRSYFEKQCPYSDAECWTTDYLGEMQSTLFAYYEFRLFIAWYLMYAEEHEKPVFEDFMQNQNLRVVFTLLDDLYKKLVDDYFSVRKDIVARLTSAGNTIQLTDSFILIVKDGSKSGRGIPDKTIQYLKSLFTEKENAMLERFRVRGVDLSNYKKFLEPLK